MIDLILAGLALSCSESKEVIETIKTSREPQSDKQELIQIIKTNTEKGCHEGSEFDS